MDLGLWRRKYKEKNSMIFRILNLAFFWILKNWFEQFWQQQKCGPFLNSNSLWTRATVFECWKRDLKRWQSLSKQKSWLCQGWVWGDVACEQNNSNTKSRTPHGSPLITKQIGSNPNATSNHHKKSHKHPPWQVTSPTEENKIHGVW